MENTDQVVCLIVPTNMIMNTGRGSASVVGYRDSSVDEDSCVSKFFSIVGYPVVECSGCLERFFE